MMFARIGITGAHMTLTHDNSKKRHAAGPLIGSLLTLCVVWLFYSHGSHRSEIAEDATGSSSGMQRSSEQDSIENGSRSAAPHVPVAASAAPVMQAHVSKPSSPASSALDDTLEERVAPLEALVRRGSSAAVPAVLDALRDEDWRVRSRAIDAAVNGYIAIPESALIEHAQSDPSPEVRLLALAGIAARIDPAIPQIGAIDAATARAIGQFALSDTSAEVRWQAQQVLDALDAGSSTMANEAPQSEVL